MNIKQKKRQLNRGLYIVLALLVAVTMCVTIIAFASSRRTPKAPASTTAEPQATTAEPQATTAEPQVTTAEPSEPGDDTPTSALPAMIAPVSGSLQKAFSDEIPVYSTTLEDYRVHTGIDISAKLGDAVYAVADGIVSQIYYDPMMGQVLVLEHDGGIQSIYKNVATVLPEGILVGSEVEKGAVIASVGESALIELCEDTHLHFEMKKDGAFEDPTEYVGEMLILPSQDFEG